MGWSLELRDPIVDVVSQILYINGSHSYITLNMAHLLSEAEALSQKPLDVSGPIQSDIMTQDTITLSKVKHYGMAPSIEAAFLDRPRSLRTPRTDTVVSFKTFH